MTNQKKLFYLLIILVVVVNLVVLVTFALRQSGSFSNHLLDITQPVYQLTGKVTGVEDDRLTIALKHNKDIKFTVSINQETIIRRANMQFNSTLPSATTVQSSLQNIKVGDIVTINSSEDLRKVNNSSFTANSITATEDIESILGTVDKINSGSIVITGIIPVAGAQPPPTAKEIAQPQTHVVSTNSETKVFLSGPLGVGVNKPISLNQLKSKMSITAYVKEIDGKKTAISLIAQENRPPPVVSTPVPVVSTNSASPRTTTPAITVSAAPTVSEASEER